MGMLLPAQVPRIALKASTFEGLLAYPSVPSKTVFIMSIKAAAGKTGSLDYTFGARWCPFLSFGQHIRLLMRSSHCAGLSAADMLSKAQAGPSST